MATKCKVAVKWGKESFPEVELDPSQPPLVFKSQLFSLTGVPPERQKVLLKGAVLKDDDWGRAAPKNGATIMLMGTAGDPVVVEAPKNAPVFVEDLPEEEQDVLGTKAYGSGLNNLGNTCYMNSTVQCLYSVAGLQDALARFAPAAAGGDPTTKMVVATKELFADLKRGGAPFPPFKFLLSLRERFPQFAQTGQHGEYMQQDAEECFSQVMYSLREKLKEEDGASVIDRLFGIPTATKLVCAESGEEMAETATSYTLKCNIASDTNYLHQGITLGLVEDREKTSAALGRTALFKGSSTLTGLPPYLTVQMMRFYYKADVRQKAKILRKVAFPADLDVYDFCSDALKKELEGPRAAMKEWEDEQVELRKKAPKQQKLSNGSAAAAGGSGDAEMADAAGAGPGSSASAHAGPFTGRYQLSAVLTHKGRSADSGHYVAWVRQADGAWALFDDDQIIPKTQEDVLALSGGGDWHMAYLLMYTAVRAPSAAPKAAAVPAAEAGAEAAPAPEKAAAADADAAAPAPMDT
ncbi:ubiquitin carboxyl-terminal hydrolase [Raphidocelis subcapitata]|uniref:Ubiquitin carboxyl-terminal hydrolase n=1 Tax=Raphidocelis subcapitata TaxID=307507 RepID=A0A2V0P142_9CHLO|nr:ubiquitin carboxyl-terminal hydrolase [Raphidocelis subcapitata]|eukprot:GBF93289.1 ubiquitin carboxyl-terminal hydrolase [Raphidocelis subcapitata]